MRVGFLTNIFTPYKEALFRELAKIVDLRVYYSTVIERNRSWHIPVNCNYRYEILPGFSFNYGEYHCHVNSGLALRLHTDQIDVLIIGGYSYPTVMLAPFVAKAKKIPAILWSGSTGYETRKFSFLTGGIKKILIKQYDAYVGYTSKASEYLNQMGASQSKTFIAPVTIDSDFFIGEAKKIRKKNGDSAIHLKYASQDTFIISCVGSLIERKNIKVLLQALAELDKYKIKLCIAGVGALKEKLVKNAKKNKVASKINWLGNLSQEKLVELYVATDVFVLPSVSDPSGNVINEAMSVGCPAIISDRIGTDVVRHGIDGFIFNAFDAKGLASYIEQLILSEDLLKKMSSSAAKRIIDDFSIQAEAEKFKNAIEFVLTEKEKGNGR